MFKHVGYRVRWAWPVGVWWAARWWRCRLKEGTMSHHINKLRWSVWSNINYKSDYWSITDSELSTGGVASITAPALAPPHCHGNCGGGRGLASRRSNRLLSLHCRPAVEETLRQSLLLCPRPPLPRPPHHQPRPLRLGPRLPLWWLRRVLRLQWRQVLVCWFDLDSAGGQRSRTEPEGGGGAKWHEVNDVFISLDCWKNFLIKTF